MADDSAVIKIKNLQHVSGDIYAMANKAATTPKGDIYNLPAGSTEVTFKIAKNIPSTPNWTYSFNNSPFCAYVYGTTPCTITTGVPPHLNFAITKVPGNDRQFTLIIPDLTANPDVVYRLFVDRKIGATQAETITIDPRITNGGNPPYLKILASYETLSIGTLLFLAFPVFVTGTLMGRAWAQSEHR